jgi:enterochelin esterase family protein
MPVWSALAGLTREAKLPPAVYLLIDAIDNEHRSRSCPVTPISGWRCRKSSCLGAANRAFSDRADRTVVAGQSFGGLAAMFAALNWPQRFGCVLSQSGSYWWPHRGGAQTAC